VRVNSYINCNRMQSFGHLSSQLGPKQEAINELDNALQLDPNYEPLLFMLSIVEKMREGQAPKISSVVILDYYKDLDQDE